MKVTLVVLTLVTAIGVTTTRAVADDEKATSESIEASIEAQLAALEADFEPFWGDRLPDEEGEEDLLSGISVDADALLPDSVAYYRYQGSLTTPPCSEGVQWFVDDDSCRNVQRADLGVSRDHLQ